MIKLLAVAGFSLYAETLLRLIALRENRDIVLYVTSYDDLFVILFKEIYYLQRKNYAGFCSLIAGTLSVPSRFANLICIRHLTFRIE